MTKKVGNIDFENPPYEVGEYVDINVRVYLPKETKEHFGSPDMVATGVAYTMNVYYEKFQDLAYWSADRLWFAPLDGKYGVGVLEEI